MFGSGSSTDDTLISKIVELVTEKIKSSEQKVGAGSNLLPPTAELVATNQSTPPLHFNNTIVKNDDNDSFGKLENAIRNYLIMFTIFLLVTLILLTYFFLFR